MLPVAAPSGPEVIQRRSRMPPPRDRRFLRAFLAPHAFEFFRAFFHHHEFAGGLVALGPGGLAHQMGGSGCYSQFIYPPPLR
jgi:hypothetical protein